MATPRSGWCYHMICLVLMTRYRGCKADLVFKAFDQAISHDAVNVLRGDAIAHFKAEQKSMMHRKLSTHWLSITDYNKMRKPRIATEAAIVALGRMSFSRAQFEDHGIVGAEWWYQVKEADDEIGFHYDKDEGIASNEMRLVFPVFSTVTYLGDVGGPTTVFNMTSFDGNTNKPSIASDVFISHPKSGRHILFNGNLMHGVIAPLLKPPVKSVDPFNLRVTLLVNWWSQAPKPPNCVALNKESLRLYRPLDSKSKLKFSVLDPVLLELTTVQVKDEEDSLTISLRLPPAEYQEYQIPQSLGLPNSIGHAELGEKTSLGGVSELDLRNEAQVAFLFRSPKPKVYYFAAKDNIDSKKRLFMRVIKPYRDSFLIFFAGKRAEDLYGYFGLKFGRKLPAIGIHDTQTKKFHLLEKVDKPRLISFMKNFRKDDYILPTSQKKGSNNRNEL